MTMLGPEEERLIDAKEVAQRLGISKSTLKRLRQTPDSGAPKPVRLEVRCVRWRLSDILEYVANL